MTAAERGFLAFLHDLDNPAPGAVVADDWYTRHPNYIPRGTPLDWAWVGDDAELLLLALEITTRDAIANRHGLGVLQAHYAKTAERLGEVSGA